MEKEKLSKVCLHRYRNKEGHMVIQLCPMDGKLNKDRLILTPSQINKFCNLVRKGKSTYWKRTQKFAISDEDPELYALADRTMTKHIEVKIVEWELKQALEKKVD